MVPSSVQPNAQHLQYKSGTRRVGIGWFTPWRRLVWRSQEVWNRQGRSARHGAVPEADYRHIECKQYTMKQFYITHKDGTQEGPYDDETLWRLLRHGTISDQTLVWETSTPGWVPLAEILNGKKVAPAPAAHHLMHDGHSTEPPLHMPPLPEYACISYYVASGIDERSGPFSYEALIEMLHDGSLTLRDMVWKENGNEWYRASEVLAMPSDANMVRRMADSMANLVGIETIKGFHARKFFGDIFKKHSEQEIVDFFCAGSSKTTPLLSTVNPAWPSPWIFTRVLLLSILLYIGFNWACNEFENPLLVPGLLFAGNFAVPFSFLVLFAELNLVRNVSWYTIGKMIIGGGLISLIVASVLYANLKPGQAYWAGPIEEMAKLLATVLMARKYFLNGQILTGLLCGAAVGTGFAIFESMGYVFSHIGWQIALSVSGADDAFVDPDAVMLMRALLSPFCHIIWTAIMAGALWKVSTAFRFSPVVFLNSAFLRIAIVPVLLHMLWNSNYMPNHPFLKYGFCGLVGWMLVLLLVNEGISQIANMKQRMSSTLNPNYTR